MSIKDDTETYFKDVVFLVEADSFAQHALWLTRFHGGRLGREIESWEAEGSGYAITIGHIDRRPVVLSLFYAKIEGRRVCFFAGESQVVDHRMIDEWLEKRTKHIRWDRGSRPRRARRAVCDATNFHLCLDAVRELNR